MRICCIASVQSNHLLSQFPQTAQESGGFVCMQMEKGTGNLNSNAACSPSWRKSSQLHSFNNLLTIYNAIASEAWQSYRESLLYDKFQLVLEHPFHRNGDTLSGGGGSHISHAVGHCFYQDALFIGEIQDIRALDLSF